MIRNINFLRENAYQDYVQLIYCVNISTISLPFTSSAQVARLTTLPYDFSITNIQNDIPWG